MSGKRYKKISLASGVAALAALTIAGGLPSASARVVAQEASATALIADTALTNPIQSTTVTATGTSGPNTDSEVSLSVGSLLEVNALNVSAQTKNAKAPDCQGPVECQGAFAHATSEVANASLNLDLAGNVDLPILDDVDLEAMLELTASVIKSECRLDAHNLLARTTILDAHLGVALLTSLLGSADLELDALLELEPNTTIDLLDGLVRIVINEQIIDWDPEQMDHASVTVNAVHVTSVLLDIDVIIAQSNCEITGGGRGSVDLGNSWVTNDSTLEIDVDGGAEIDVPLLPIGDLIDLLDDLLVLPVDEIVEIVDEIVPLPVGQILTNASGSASLNLGGLLNLDLNALLSASLLGGM